MVFWNVENCFDTVDDSLTEDEEFLPESFLGWNQRVYQYKMEQIGRILKDVKPVLVGLAEVENRRVLEDLRKRMGRPEQWGILHREGPDRRGIDCALFYRQDLLECLHEDFFVFRLPSGNSTREALMGEFRFRQGGGEAFIICVLHYPSRRGGARRSLPDRLACSRQLIIYLQQNYSRRKILIMGDLNAPANTEPVRMLDRFYPLLLKGADAWTYVYQCQRQQLDHFLASPEFLRGLPRIQSKSPRVLRPPAMQDEFGFPEPFIKNRRIYGGFSDHYLIELRVVGCSSRRGAESTEGAERQRIFPPAKGAERLRIFPPAEGAERLRFVRGIGTEGMRIYSSRGGAERQRFIRGIGAEGAERLRIFRPAEGAERLRFIRGIGAERAEGLRIYSSRGGCREAEINLGDWGGGRGEAEDFSSRGGRRDAGNILRKLN